ncbi:hypothetical protein Tco_1189434 [Tanacetum coccineum]
MYKFQQSFMDADSGDDEWRLSEVVDLVVMSGDGYDSDVVWCWRWWWFGGGNLEIMNIKEREVREEKIIVKWKEARERR